MFFSNTRQSSYTSIVLQNLLIPEKGILRKCSDPTKLENGRLGLIEPVHEILENATSLTLKCNFAF